MANNDVIKQEEINSVAWRACDTFRGVVDPAEYKNYILVMLFLKYISDVFKSVKESLANEYQGDTERLERRLRRERFFIPENCSFDYLYRNREKADIGELINEALEKIQEANKTTLEGVFRNIDFNSELALGQTRDRNKRLKHLLEDFADERMDLSPARIGNQDIIGDCYQYLIERFASDAGKKGGEFYTPHAVAQLLAKLVQPKKGDRIADPACGSASLLIKVAQETGSRDCALYGQESNGSTWALAKMNCFLHGVDSARIEWGDTIRNPKLLEGDSLMLFDIVVANPPFSLDKWGADDAAKDQFLRFHRGIPPKSKGDFAFITHMIQTTNPQTGRVGVIVPHGVLFRGASEGKIRQALVEENLLDAVIGLPANLFFGTGIPAAILIFDRAKKDTNVLFIDASDDYQEGKNQNKLRPEDIEKVFKAFSDRKPIPKYSHLATSKEIKENDFNLNISRYVDTFEEEEQIDIKAVEAEIEKLEGELAQARENMKGYLKELGI